MSTQQTVPAFKEWAIICQLIAEGRQSIILRKGGIAEGRAGFHFAHPRFYLYPTLFHEQIQRTTLPPETPLPDAPGGDAVVIGCHCEVEWTLRIEQRDALEALAPFHFWRPDVVEERFCYDERQPPGIFVAAVRAHRITPPWELPMQPRYGGCRSWVELPEPAIPFAASPALDDRAHHERMGEIAGVLEAFGVSIPAAHGTARPSEAVR